MQTLFPPTKRNSSHWNSLDSSLGIAVEGCKPCRFGGVMIHLGIRISVQSPVNLFSTSGWRISFLWAYSEVYWEGGSVILLVYIIWWWQPSSEFLSDHHSVRWIRKSHHLSSSAGKFQDYLKCLDSQLAEITEIQELSLLWGWLNTGMGLSERCGVCPWRYSKFSWTQSLQPVLAYPALCRGFGLEDLWGPFPPQLFYNSMILWIILLL